MTRSLSLFSATAPIIIIAACGQTTNSDTQSEPGGIVDVVETFGALPPCDSDTEGALYFVADDSSYFVCARGEYEQLFVATSAPGQDGEAGTEGPRGDAGQDGETGKEGESGQDGASGLDGVPGASVEVVSEPPGDNCPSGGIVVQSGAVTTYVCAGLQGDDCTVTQIDNSARVDCGSDSAGGAGGGSATNATINGLKWLGAMNEKPSNPGINHAFYWTEARTSCIWDGDSWEVYGASADSRPGGCEPYTRTFLSSTTVTGNLGGYAGGDAECQRLADAQGLGGRWAAWISDSTSSPSKRFTKNTIPYRLLDATLVAQNWLDLTDGVVGVDIKSDEIGNGNILTRVFTGTDKNGNAVLAATCLDWSTGSGAQSGIYGASNFGDDPDYPKHWTDRGSNACDAPIRLYCFEQ